ncbi:MAG: hypothetical protein AB1706_18065 [Pseudomonadota bacterium]
MQRVYGFSEKLLTQDSINYDVAPHTNNIISVTIGGSTLLIGEDYTDCQFVKKYSVGTIRNIFTYDSALFHTGYNGIYQALRRYNISTDTFDSVMQTPDNGSIYDYKLYNNYCYLAHTGSAGHERWHNPSGAHDDITYYGVLTSTSRIYSLGTYGDNILHGGGSSASNTAAMGISSTGASSSFVKFWKISDYYEPGHPKYDTPYVLSINEFKNDLYWGTGRSQVWRDKDGYKEMVHEFDASDANYWVRPMLVWKNNLYASNSYDMAGSQSGDDWISINKPVDCAYITRFYQSGDGESFIITGRDTAGAAAAWSTSDFISYTKFYSNPDYSYFYCFYDSGVDLYFGTNDGVLKVSTVRLPKSRLQPGPRVEKVADIRHLVLREVA